MNLILLFLITLCAVYEWPPQLAAPGGTGVSPRSVKTSGGISLSLWLLPTKHSFYAVFVLTLYRHSYLIKLSFLTPFYGGANLSLEKLRGKTGTRTHFFLQRMKVKSESKVAQLCPTFQDPVDCSLPSSSVHGIFQVWLNPKTTVKTIGLYCISLYLCAQ